MKFPFNLKVMYIGRYCFPINTVDSTHYIGDSDDLNVLTCFINIFSEHSWDESELMGAISLSQHSFLTRTNQDDSLHLIIIQQ